MSGFHWQLPPLSPEEWEEMGKEVGAYVVDPMYPSIERNGRRYTVLRRMAPTEPVQSSGPPTTVTYWLEVQSTEQFMLLLDSMPEKLGTKKKP